MKNTGNIEATTFDELGFDTTGLLAYWPLAGDAVDQSGNKRNGTVNALYATASTDQLGVANHSYELDATDIEHKITVPNSANLFESGDMTMSCWICPTNLTANAFFFCHYDWRFLNSSTTVGQIRFDCGRMDDGAGPIYLTNSTNITLTNGNWYHLVGLYHPDAIGGNGYISLYINGVFQQQTSIGSHIMWTGYGAKNLQWGNSNHGAAVPFQGKVSTSFVAQRIFTDQEILDLYNHDLGKFRLRATGVVEANEFKEDSTITPQVQYKKELVSLKGELVEI